MNGASDAESPEAPAPGRRALIAALTGLGALAAGAARARPAVLAPPPIGALPDDWLAAPTIPLWPGGPPGAASFKADPPPATWPAALLRDIAAPYLKVFRPAVSNRSAILVCPGGGYRTLAVGIEGSAVAARLNGLGYTVFVLCYRLPGEGWANRADAPLADAQRAVRLIRSRAAVEGLDSGRVAALGFSAGGHLAASLAVGFDEALGGPLDAIDALPARPDAVGLLYPVISMAPPLAHQGSRLWLLGPAPSDALVKRRSPALHVTEGTPPVFIAVALDDPTVPAYNAFRMASALREARRPVELHAFQEGAHGFGVGYPGSPCGTWTQTFDAWLRRAVDV